MGVINAWTVVLQNVLNTMDKHTKIMKLQEDDYYYEGKRMVFTKQYHLRRGFCCGSVCRNCPYDYENVI